MADSPRASVRVHNDLQSSERLHALNSIAKTRRVYKDSIQRVEDIITVQEKRVKKMGHQSVGTSSQTLRLRASVKDSIAIYRLTLQQIRQSAEALELSWAMLEGAQQAHGSDHGH